MTEKQKKNEIRGKADKVKSRKELRMEDEKNRQTTAKIREIQYRGSLKSCNYSCSYCPFAKRSGSRGEFERDEAALKQLVGSLSEKIHAEKEGAGRGILSEKLGILIVPYGEALIHSYYWKEMAALSRLFSVRAVGAQTNLSFQLEKSLDLYEKEGGVTGKLRLWATFHPQMVEAERFADGCRYLLGRGVKLSAGVVGVPEGLSQIERLRSLLPEEIYLWINRMDGLHRPYTREEKESFMKIDPWFFRELHWPKTDPKLCQTRLFLESDGTERSCNLSGTVMGNWYQDEERIESPCSFLPASACHRKQCTCYLSASGRRDFPGNNLFDPFPQFRIPKLVKAWFFDVDETLTEGEREITEEMSLWFQGLRGKRFLATSLPVQEARRRCRRIWKYLDGGIFNSGAYIVSGKEKKDESIFPISESVCQCILRWADHRGLNVRIYRWHGIPLKAVVKIFKYAKKIEEKPETKEYREKTGKKAAESLRRELADFGMENVRVFIENGRIQVVDGKAKKEKGAALLSKRFQIPLNECGAAGDSEEDLELLRLCGVKFFGEEMRNIRGEVQKGLNIL